MSELKTPFRADYVGSFLRPQKLKDAKKDYESGKISREQLTAVEDECISDLVRKQKATGFHVITDGEFRRSFWHLDFMWGFEGVAHEDTGGGVQFNGELARLDEVFLTGKIKAGTHPFVEHFRFVKQFEDENTVAKQTIPAPAQTFQQFVTPKNMLCTRKFYPTDEELIEDIAAAYRKVIADLYAAGCRNIQFDDCTWGVLVANGSVERYGKGADLDAIKAKLLKVNNLAIEDLPDDLMINTHVCRGNYHSTYFSSGPYDSVAPELLGKENVNAYYLEFDDERSGGFEPLKYVSGDKKVVLGLITTKSPVLEDKAAVIARIKEAAKIIPLERLCLSPQCGFASCEIGNKLTEEEQWAKLRLVKEIADEVWK
ncbi:MAG: 5-methyltetrahydropteroyltriglutamate--homocysteine S-methyltransferase [Ruminiclostridium sp.]|uniref:5-methyltetrahydropteroyltriglutamate-- homocysteine S-methyltransferase n=1 Tax=Ruminococcus sp. TaxID=41978 RepID=UPI0025DC3374|nr:5-methyltetrahydropteroyltriglutamate--homocysteine S-methyltransferase [Ruminococcus sp.]MBR1432556.1 5-methyltetrahydropteroyltriglutamate--homocysteine S-methyltransferase [Ruminococcus sp.]MBR1832642.1 5-methyltetrahydropteroyltriglutamate--homocysteine S-methyltransferase [Ruminiclostridium sp.]